MQKIFVIISLVCSLGAAGLGYMNREKLISANALLEKTKSELQATELKLTKKTQEFNAATEKIAQLEKDKERLTAELNDTKGSLAKEKANTEDLQKQVTEKNGIIDRQKTDLDAKDTRIAELETKINSAQTVSSQNEELKKQVEEKDLLIAGQQAKLKDADNQIAEWRKREEKRKQRVMQKGLEGKILAVNSAWNFVVLSLGDRNGVFTDSEMLIKRGAQLIGKVRITSVEPSTSIADILANSIPAGVTVQPGDSVIFLGNDEEQPLPPGTTPKP